MATSLVWFRNDLRLHDNPALAAAVASHDRVVPVYVFDPEALGDAAPGAASRWWLHFSLAHLQTDLEARRSRLVLARGDAEEVLRRLIHETGATRVYWNRRYEPQGVAQDRRIKQRLRDAGVAVQSFKAALLHEPWEVTRGDRGHYRVFTPFWRNCLSAPPPAPPLPAPEYLTTPPLEGLDLEALGLLPRIPWDGGLRAHWTPGEAGAQARLAEFCDGDLGDYREGRDRPGSTGTSRLSPHLHFGELSPRQVWHALETSGAPLDAIETLQRELGWREFAHHLLFHFPELPQAPIDARFRAFPWADDLEGLSAWQRGRTGVPLVDAGMRELWHTGWMHNRVRMVVASFLVKNLRLPWQSGAAWFWDTLVDADLANNAMGWQWVAGCGADAAPFFRVFNPVLQGEKFDPRGDYVRRWLPELARLPDRYLHRPWEAPAALLRQAGVRLGENYPHPLVNLKTSREAALAAFRGLPASAPANRSRLD